MKKSMITIATMVTALGAFALAPMASASGNLDRAFGPNGNQPLRTLDDASTTNTGKGKEAAKHHHKKNHPHMAKHHTKHKAKRDAIKNKAGNNTADGISGAEDGATGGAAGGGVGGGVVNGVKPH